jgi:hypothetical protein
LRFGFNLSEARFKRLALFYLFFPSRAIPMLEPCCDSPSTSKTKDLDLTNLPKHSLQQLSKKQCDFHLFDMFYSILPAKTKILAGNFQTKELRLQKQSLPSFDDAN